MWVWVSILLAILLWITLWERLNDAIRCRQRVDELLWKLHEAEEEGRVGDSSGGGEA